MSIKKVYESESVLVTDKPAGIVVEDFAAKVKEESRKLKELPRFGLVHRLDKGTSGILLFAKKRQLLDDLQEQFKERKVKKKYICLAWRPLKKKEGRVITAMRRGKNDRRKHQSYDPSEKGRRAISDYKELENFENYSLIEVSPRTGRRHQIRSQFAYLGHPIVGDSLYGFKDQKDPVEMNRLFLHSSSLEIRISGNKKRFVSELPEDLQKVIEEIKK